MVENRGKCVCFTGHRPEKLTRMQDEIKQELKYHIRSAIEEGFNRFITGLAKGTDIWAAQIVLRLRDDGYPVKLICASPYEGFERSWSKEWQKQYREIIESADDVHYICEGYSRSCFQTRNKWMVDHSSQVIAVFNGQKGGTQNTIDYANWDGR